MDINKVIRSSSFFIEEELYSIAKVSGNIDTDKCFMLTSDNIEKTVIFSQNVKLENITEQRNDFNLIGIDVSLPFEAFGFLSSITHSLAKNKIPVLVISTFSRDYLLVKNISIDMAKNALLEIGLEEKLI